jgi:hypothetical protein
MMLVKLKGRCAMVLTMTKREFLAVWFDPKKVQEEAERRGWDPKSGDGYLDFYHPDEDPAAGSAKSFSNLEAAVNHLKAIVAGGGDVFGQGRIRELEAVPSAARCRYCTCRGLKLVKTHWVDESGIDASHDEDDCLDEE